ncbi:MAG: TlpA disulfide reductase family protein [Weeksellaceae bacterium]|nr:TlpA disulfide reductase family protein [Weeksellaceae bacterium]
MKNYLLILLLCIPFLGFSAYKINGKIESYDNRPVIIKIYDNGVSRAVQRVMTDSDGKFTYQMPTAYVGIIDLELTQGTLQVIALNEDVNFQVSLQDPLRKVNYSSGKASQLDTFLNIKELQDLRDFTLKELLHYYTPDQSFHKALNTEIERINALSGVMPEHPALQYYIRTKEKLKNYERGLLSPQAVMTDLELTLSQDPDYLEQFGFLPEMVSIYLSNASAGSNSRDEMERKMERSLDQLLDKVVAETRRGQALLSNSISLFEGARFTRLSRKYTQQVADMTCALNDDLQQLVNATKNMNPGDQVPNIEFNHAVKGKKSLYDIKADKKLIIFWGSWCPHCVNELPYIKEFYKNFKAGGGEILAFALDMEAQDYLTHVADTEWYNYSDLMKWDSPVAKKYGVVATPSMVLVDKNNKIIKKGGRISDFLNF